MNLAEHMPQNDLPFIARDSLKTRIFGVVYVKQESPGWHVVNWRGSEVLASSLKGFQASVGDILMIARSGIQQTILSSPRGIGHWSDWFTPAPVLLTADVSFYFGSQRVYRRSARIGSELGFPGYPSGPNASDFDFSINGPFLFQGVLDDTGVSSSNGAYYLEEIYYSSTGGGSIDGISLRTYRDRIGRNWSSFPASDDDPFYYEDNVFQEVAAGVYGLRYSVTPPRPLEVPGPETYVQYEDGGVSTINWQSLDVVCRANFFATHYLRDKDTAISVINDTVTSAEFDIVVPPDATTQASPFWPDPDDGLVVSTVPIYQGDGSGYDVVASLSLNSIASTRSEFWLYVRTPYLRSDSVPDIFLSTNPNPTIVDDADRNAEFFELDASLRFVNAPEIKANYQLPRARYWISDV